MKVIAELCQNHNGDINIVKRMVDAAAESGATHVKIQHIYSRNVTYRPQFESGLEVDGEVKSIKRPFKPEVERLRGLELTLDQCREFAEHARDVGLEPLTTCFARGTLPEIRELGFKSIKVASYDCASFPLLDELAAAFDYLIVSTGATFDDEIAYAATRLKGKCDFSFLHCVTLYPTPLEEMHLARIDWLRQFATEVGFSDHSDVSKYGVLAAKAAIACGAEVVERHFTIMGRNETKDGPVSVTPELLKDLVRFSQMSKEDQVATLDAEAPNWRRMLGASRRWLSHEELLNRAYYRGRFATPRREGVHDASEMIFNWEATPL